MRKDEIIRMTREAGGFDATPEFLERFAALVAAAEREACARVADKQDGDEEGDADVCIWSKSARHIAAAIRARGNT
jgi:hypothetical protein